MRFIPVHDEQGVAQQQMIEWLYKLLREREEEHQHNISFKLPPFDEHVRFVQSNPYRYWYLIEGTPPLGLLGYISATHRNEIGVVLTKWARGRGFGTQAVSQFVTSHKPLPEVPSERAGRWLANINPANAASIAMFKGCGFSLLQHTYAL